MLLVIFNILFLLILPNPEKPRQLKYALKTFLQNDLTCFDNNLSNCFKSSFRMLGIICPNYDDSA